MPKKEIDYQKAVIYKIEHLEKPELLYVGSTTEFIKRKSQHKYTCNNEKSSKYNYKIYKMIRENGGWDCFKILIIKQYPCLNKIELLIEEDRLMKELKSSLNHFKAYRTEEYTNQINKEYRDKNKDKINEYCNKYREDNKDKIKERNKIYRDDNKDKIKEYREDNKDKIKDYYTKNKDTLIICDCGCKIKYLNKNRHIKTSKHITKLQSI
jgi:hypothetical protein